MPQFLEAVGGHGGNQWELWAFTGQEGGGGHGADRRYPLGNEMHPPCPEAITQARKTAL